MNIFQDYLNDFSSIKINVFQGSYICRKYPTKTLPTKIKKGNA